MTPLRQPRHLPAITILCACLCTAATAQGVVVFSEGRPCIYLDVTDQEALDLGLRGPIGDLCTYFERMTGKPLARAGGAPMLFDPGREQPTRFEMRVVRMADASSQASVNADAGLCLSPTLTFESQPFAGPGEKVGWVCSWDRAAKTLTYRLTVANQPYYGPGYGPFTAATLSSPVPDFEQGGSVKLALETRSAGLRGGYCLDGDDWRYTDWFHPVSAGADTREPGKSDKNGPQAWTEDWPQRWSGATAMFVTAYAAKEREAAVWLDDVRVSHNAAVLFHSDFSAESASARHLRNWCRTPYAGTSEIEDGRLILRPAVGGWNTVGLRANRAPETAPADLIPLRLVKEDYPAGVSAFDAAEVQRFTLDTSPGSITVRATTRLGLQNGIYYLLRHWGCRWVMVGELGECIPRVERLVLPAGTVSFAPRSDFAVEPSGGGGPYAQYWARNMAGWQNWLTAQHYWFYAIPPDKHFKDHPEWYSLIAGKRQPKQLCTSNPEVIAEMIRVAKDFLRGSPNRMSFPMDPMDGIDFCQCPQCLALDAPGQFTRGAPSVTDRVLHFANAVAEGIREEFPDRYVAFYSYWTHSDLPVRERPADNVIVVVTRSGHCMLHLTPHAGCPTSDFHEFVRRWRKLTPMVYCYEYDPISWTGGLPCPTYLDMASSLKTLLTEVGARGSYSDAGVRPAAWAGTFLNRYIPLQMKVDPDQEPEAVLRDACEAFFGPAAGPMEQYYLELAKVTDSHHPGRDRVGVGTTFYHQLFNPALIARSREALDRGMDLTRGKAPYEQRTAMVDMAQQYLEAYLGGVWAAQAKDYDGALASFDRMDGLISALDERGWVDGTDARRRAKAMRLKALAKHFPGRLGYVTRWRILGPFDNTSHDADQRRDPFEPIRSTDEAVTTADDVRAEWWDYTSPGGLLNLETALAARKGDWTLSYCYASTVVDSPRAVPAQLKLDSFFPYRVSLNGEEVYYRPGLNADCPDRTTVDVSLRKGTNLIVVKLSQTQLTGDTFPWGLYLRIVPDEAQDVAVLPEQWAFRTDPEGVGTARGWFAPQFDDSQWQRIKVGVPWETTEVGPYDGDAWYRARFMAPATLPAGKMSLQFGGVDEQAWVYLNGTLIGERTVESTGRPVGEIWEQPFSLPVPPDCLKPGAENVLAIRVNDSAFAGGIYRAVRLVMDE